MNSINTNRMALNAANALSRHYSRMAASVGRLSSGLRVCSSDDDAAGLAIRELMRADIAATAQGIRNANDAISLVQVADGALGIIDEKLIRMKELAEQAATGTYNSDQRLVIDSEFKAMAAEIDRIAAATDFNGIRLLDGTLTGAHNGSGLVAAGRMKIHFGAANDSAEDYYYLESMNCSTKGLGLRDGDESGGVTKNGVELAYADVIAWPPFASLNDYVANHGMTSHGRSPFDVTGLLQGHWYCGEQGGIGSQNTMLLIKKGTKNFVLNEIGCVYGDQADNDIQLFTRDGKHLAGRAPIPDYHAFGASESQPTDLASNCGYIGFTLDQYDTTYLNSGVREQDNGSTMNFTSYNGMTIGYSGDGQVEYDGVARYEVLSINEVTEDLVVWLPGKAGAVFKYYTSDDAWTDIDDIPMMEGSGNVGLIGIETQEKAQRALERIDGAIVAKDKVRAYLGAIQNRLENTVTHLSIQRENLQAAESQISDVDISAEMTNFVRSQIKAQAGIAMLSQANSLPRMALSLLNS